MKWFSALSEKPDALQALDEVVGRTREAEDGPPDLCFLYPSAEHAKHFERLPEELHKRLGPKSILGCSGGGIIAGGQEVEHRAALGLLSAWLPGVSVRPFSLEQKDMPSPDAAPKAWRQWLGAAPEQASGLVLLSDPFTLNAEELIRGLDYAYPSAVKIGGLASGFPRPGGNVLYLGARALRAGAVGAAFSGDIAIDPIVAQGCRPIGRPLKVTKCDRNLLMELDGKPTLEALESMLESLSENDQRLARSALFIGLLGDPTKTSGKDYLVRNLLGLDAQRGILAVGAPLRNGQTVRFHLRDGAASSQDLADRLSGYAGAKTKTKPVGAMLFSCLGRGRHLYQRDNHDSDLLTQALGPLAVGGFFCNGEIGPVDGSTYLHGYTSCFGLIRALETTR